jgi:hypothetical protein
MQLIRKMVNLLLVDLHRQRRSRPEHTRGLTKSRENPETRTKPPNLPEHR